MPSSTIGSAKLSSIGQNRPSREFLQDRFIVPIGAVGSNAPMRILPSFARIYLDVRARLKYSLRTFLQDRLSSFRPSGSNRIFSPPSLFACIAMRPVLHAYGKGPSGLASSGILAQKVVRQRRCDVACTADLLIHRWGGHLARRYQSISHPLQK